MSGPMDTEITQALEAHANGAEISGTPAFVGALLDALEEARTRSTYFAFVDARTAAERAEARAENAEQERDLAVKLLRDCVETAEEGWSYADEYFRVKWDYEEALAPPRAFLAGLSDKGEG